MKICELGKIADVSIGVTLRRYEGENNMKVIFPGSFDKINGIRDDDLKDMKLSDKLNDKYFTKNGDILIKSKSPHDAIYVDKEGLVVGERVVIIRLKEPYNPKFIAHQLNSKYVQNQIKKVRSGDNKLVPVKNIRELKIKLPNLEIQKDYAIVLDSFNKRIIDFNKLIKIEDKLWNEYLNNLIGGE